MITRRKLALFIGLPLAAYAVAALAIYHFSNRPTPALVHVQETVGGLMNANCECIAVGAFNQTDQARQAIRQAQQHIRDLEAMLAAGRSDSPIGRFNAAAAGQVVSLPPEVLAIVRQGLESARATDGACDITCGPLTQLWQQCGDANRLPASDELVEAMAQVGCDKIMLTDNGASKSLDGVKLELGGLAKGFAADQAAGVMIKADLAGGIVNLGGSIRCWGVMEDRQKWRVRLQHPWRDGRDCGTLVLGDGAISISADHRAFYTIAGRRYSRILDPYMGWPAERVPSVTVISLPTKNAPPSAAAADAWRIALSVLGPSGLSRLARVSGFEAMMVTGAPDEPQVHMTPGFKALLENGTIRLD